MNSPLMRFGIVIVVVAATTAPAVVDESLIPEFAVRDKLDEDVRVTALGEAPAAAYGIQREEARKRAEKIRTLPADKVSDWMQGRLTETDLHQLEADSRPPPVQQKTLPPNASGRLLRLTLATTLSVVLAFCMWNRRRHDSGQKTQRQTDRH